MAVNLPASLERLTCQTLSENSDISLLSENPDRAKMSAYADTRALTEASPLPGLYHP